MIKHINNVCKCLKDTQLAVREATINVIEAMYPEERLHEKFLLNQLETIHNEHLLLLKRVNEDYKLKQMHYKKRRGKHSILIQQLRKKLRKKMLVYHNEIQNYENLITQQMKKYQHLVELMRRERINRQYQQHSDEIALHDARSALVDSDASDSDSDDPDRPSATSIVQKMMKAEENEKKRERERGQLLTDCRMFERKLRSQKDVVLKSLDACYQELKEGEKKFKRNISSLDKEIKNASLEIKEVRCMIHENLLIKKNLIINEIHFNERYRRTIISFVSRHGEKERNIRKLKESKRSKHLPPLPITPRLQNKYKDEIRLSAVQALKLCHTQWEGTYYKDSLNILVRGDEPNTQIRGAAIDFMTFVSSPDDAFQYAPNVLHSLQSTCSVLRTGATNGARALGAVPLQQAAKFTRSFEGPYGPTLKKNQIKPKIGGYQKRDTYVPPQKLREIGDLLEIFKLIDLDGNGILDKSEGTFTHRMLMFFLLSVFLTFPPFPLSFFLLSQFYHLSKVIHCVVE